MKYRVLRGGSFYYDSYRGLRSANRDRDEPEYRSWYFGFRVVVKRRKP